ncbi:MAG TPA: glycogen/starch synthase [Candidatus Saccharimonadia bacterium]|nr:glycogen/starch synthase [Candidatus Saccharimonadia bacterium]
MNILMIAGEVAPYAKTGGLGEVMAALPKAVRRLGHDVRVFMPRYGTIDRQTYPLVPIGKTTNLVVGGEKTPISFSASILAQEVPIYFLESAVYFPPDQATIYDSKRGNLPFYAFNLSVFRLLETLDWVPDIIHVHDWHAGLIPNIIKYLPASSPFAGIATVETIHNSAYVAIADQWAIPEAERDCGEGLPPTDLSKVKYINFLKRGIVNADIVTTVSEQYAKELVIPGTSHGLSEALIPRLRTFFGIRNGVDYSYWNPMFDHHLPVNYDYEIMHRKYDNKRALQHRLNLPILDVPILGMNSRITEQKGFSLILKIFDKLMEKGVQLVVVGDATSGSSYVEFLTEKMKLYPNQVSFRPYSEELGSLVYAGSDIFLMPSLFEPSGLGQLVSLRYGTIPVVRRTGGLADTISDYNPRNHTGNGFVFDEYTGTALAEAIWRALDLWDQKDKWWNLMQHGMALSYSWEIPAKKYVRIYKAALKEKAGASWSIPKRW